MVGSGSLARTRGVGHVLRVLAIGALMAMATAVSAPVGAAGDNDQVGCIPINYTTCVMPMTGAYTVPTAPYTAPATTTTTTTAPAYTAPTQTLPGNSLLTTYFDPRYCGDGSVSLVTDSTGHVINVCTSTGVRIYPAFPDFAPYGAYGNGFYGNGTGVLPYTGFYGNGYAPAYLNGLYAYGNVPVAPFTGNYVNGYYGAPYYGTAAFQYTDNRFCGDGQVTYTPGGYFCTTTGVPAYRSA